MPPSDLARACQALVEIARQVYAWRLPDGSLPFGTCDYYALEDAIAAGEAALATLARQEATP